MDRFALLPAGRDLPVIYLFADPDMQEVLSDDRANLVLIQGVDWDRDLTPWPAPGAFKGQNFSGGAGEFLAEITNSLIPAAEAELGVQNPVRGILGYSLAGLFALYALYSTDAFSLCGCVSGSLWYDGWTDYMAAHPLTRPARVHLSVGDREKKSRNLRMAKVEDCFREAEALLRDQGAEVTFVLNPGNHFQEPLERQRRALDWLLTPSQNKIGG